MKRPPRHQQTEWVRHLAAVRVGATIRRMGAVRLRLRRVKA